MIRTLRGLLREDQEQHFSYNYVRALEKYWKRCISVEGDYVESDKIMM